MVGAYTIFLYLPFNLYVIKMDIKMTDIDEIKREMLNEFGGNGIVNRGQLEDMEWVIDYLHSRGYLGDTIKKPGNVNVSSEHVDAVKVPEGYFIARPSVIKWDKTKYGDVIGDAFGSYSVRKRDNGTFFWWYCYDEYYDEGQFDCESIEDGKEKCQEHYDKFVLRLLDVAAPKGETK